MSRPFVPTRTSRRSWTPLPQWNTSSPTGSTSSSSSAGTALWDFPNNLSLERLGAAVFERGGVVAAVCHGPAALVDLHLSDGSLLVAGRDVAGFRNEEERVIGRDIIVPLLLQTRLEELGARYTSAGFMVPHVVTDGRLVTGQNPVSAYGVAEAAVAALGAAR
jgi:putative intracellular protease/amidase